MEGQRSARDPTNLCVFDNLSFFFRHSFLTISQRFHPTLEAALVPLRAAIAAEKFENKSKFPTQLKPLLVTAAVKAIEVDQYDDHFFSYLPEIFPYNRFTMTVGILVCSFRLESSSKYPLRNSRNGWSTPNTKISWKVVRSQYL